MKGSVGNATLYYILRNHDENKLKKQKNDFLNAMAFLNRKYGDDTIIIEIKDQYQNMRALIEKDDRSVKRCIAAMKKLGINPITSPIRGGTDGAKLTLKGLNTPNIGTGGYNCHGPYEMACLEEMELVCKTLIEIAKD